MQALIVDDDRTIIDAARQTIRWDRLGIDRVYTAYNISSAKEILTGEQIDIVISDIEMPKGSGLDLLEWFREQGLPGEFLLLTCHERFDYATNAVKLHAAEYLLKPFDVVVMEAALKKLVLKLQEERQQQEDRELGKWAKKNKRRLRLSLLDQILTGYYSLNEQGLEREMESGSPELRMDGDYRLVISRVTDIEKDREKVSPELMLFIMENIHSEVLCDTPENDSVVCYEYKNYYVLVTRCEAEPAHRMERRCRELAEAFGRIFSAALTCCVSEPCRITEFYETYRRNLRLAESNVVDYGGFFFEKDESKSAPFGDYLLDGARLEECLNGKSKLDFLSYLKALMNEMIRVKTMNERALAQIKQELLQSVYMYLGKKDISVAGLLREEKLAALSEKAGWSVTDMIRWVNFLLERTFAYEEEAQRRYTVVDQIQQYMREHYREDIGRNEIAAAFYLTPEYLSKMYKKKTGEGLKDYLNKYRVEQAKLMLERGERVSDVAEQVGFENFTYFSTMFKKYAGISPNQYRKK